MSSTVIDIPDGEGVAPCSKEKKEEVGDICCRFPIVLFFKEMKSNKHMMRKVIHSIKVGVALVFVSLLYLINPLYEQVGENAMWAIMTVVVVFEFFAGATLSKGINRGIGTVLGGGLGCLAAIFAQAMGGVGKAIIVGITVFLFGMAAALAINFLLPKIQVFPMSPWMDTTKGTFYIQVFPVRVHGWINHCCVIKGSFFDLFQVIAMIFELLTGMLFLGAAATYTRQVPNVKKKFDYGAMIFILTFSLVVVSGLRAEQVLEIARDRLSFIAVGFAICLFISLLIFPIWASDELHDSLVARFKDLAISLEGFFKEYFGNVNEKEKSSFNFSSKCKSVLHSKTKDESLVNFASWEPWHAKFGFFYPWGIYLKLGEDLRDLATTILSLKGCLRSPTQPSESNTCRQSVKEPCDAIVASLAWTLRELGESIKKMKKCGSEGTILPKLKTVRQELSQISGPSTFGTNDLERTDGLGLATFMYSMMEMVEKMEELAKHVEQLGQLGGFS